MTRSLRFRLIVGMLLGMTVLLVTAGTVVYSMQRREQYRAFDSSLLTTANSIAMAIHPSRIGDWFDANSLARLPAGQIRQGAIYQVWSERLIAVPASRSSIEQTDEDELDDRPPPRRRRPMMDEPDDGPEGPAFGPDEPRQLRGGRVPRVLVLRSPLLKNADLPHWTVPAGQARFAELKLPDGSRGRVVATQIQLPGPPPGPGPHPPPRGRVTVAVASSAADVDTQLRSLGMLLIATALGTLALSGGVAWLVVTRGLRPLGTVARQIAGVDEKGLKQRLPEAGVPCEVEPVVKQLNGLLARLDDAFERERTLTADVAHELRTPVAEIRAIAEITLSRLRDPKEYQEAMREALDATRSLQDLIERLLILARLESGQMPQELQPMPVQPLLAAHWNRTANGAVTRGVVLDDRSDPMLKVAADAKLMDVVLSNVLANAAAYTPDGGRITVASHFEGRHCRISISNPGCELNDEQVSRVFDRFWRADAARSKSGLNCGLGLTLVRRAMEAMDGVATARVEANGAGHPRDRQFVLDLRFNAASANVH